MSTEISIPHGTQWWIRNNLEIVTVLPEPGEHFEVRDYDVLSSPVITKLHIEGVIRKVGAVDDVKRDAHLWTMTERAHNFVDEFCEWSSMTPCGHTGVRTIEAGETFTCTFDGCGETFGREVAEEVLR